MPTTDSHRFGKIRAKVPQLSPKPDPPRKTRLSKGAKTTYWGDDSAVEGGPEGLRKRGHPARYYFERQYKGQRIKESLGRSLPQARLRAQQWVNAMDRGDFSRAMLGEGKAEIGEFLAEALEALRVRSGLTQKSAASYRGRIDHFLRFLHDRHPRLSNLSDVTGSICANFVEWRRSQKVTRSGKGGVTAKRSYPAAQTVHDDIRRLRGLFKVAVERHLLKANPWSDVRVIVKGKDYRTPPKSFTEDEVRRLLKAAKQYDKAPHAGGSESTFRGMFHDMLKFYLLTGLRKEELLHLSWQMVDLDWGDYGRIQIDAVEIPLELLVYPSAVQRSRITERVSGLGKRERLFVNATQMRCMVPVNIAKVEESALLRLTADAWDSDHQRLRVLTTVEWKPKATRGRVPLIPESRAILDHRKANNPLNSPFVFPHPRDRGPLRSDPLPIFKQVLRMAGLPESFRLHDTRHTFGFTLRRKGVPLETLMGLLRHANIEETLVYSQYSDEEGAAGIQRLHGFAAAERR